MTRTFHTLALLLALAIGAMLGAAWTLAAADREHARLDARHAQNDAALIAWCVTGAEARAARLAVEDALLAPASGALRYIVDGWTD